MPTKIDFNQTNYQRFHNIQDELQKYYDEFMMLADQSLGLNKVDNVKMYLDNPADYLVNRYRTLWLKDRPPHLDFAMIFENETRVTVLRLDQLKSRFWNTHKSLGKYAPTINAKGMTTNIKKEYFNVYLDESKKDHYNALKSFLDSLDKLREYENVQQPVNFVRSINSLIMNNLTPVINTSKFIK